MAGCKHPMLIILITDTKDLDKYEQERMEEVRRMEARKAARQARDAS